MKKIVVFLSLILCMESAFSAPRMEQTGYTEETNQVQNDQNNSTLYKELNDINYNIKSLNDNIKSVESTVKFHWHIYWTIVIASIVLGIASAR
jgi:peptidoglycan hydrolase CwlO-like protein